VGGWNVGGCGQAVFGHECTEAAVGLHPTWSMTFTANAALRKGIGIDQVPPPNRNRVPAKGLGLRVSAIIQAL
jgi:hypothetical protein